MTDRPDAPDIVEIMARGYLGCWFDSLHKRDQSDCRRSMRAICEALDAAGLAVVPVDPTPEMLSAGYTASIYPDDVRPQWAAMITAGNLAGKP